MYKPKSPIKQPKHNNGNPSPTNRRKDVSGKILNMNTNTTSKTKLHNYAQDVKLEKKSGNPKNQLKNIQVDSNELI